MGIDVPVNLLNVYAAQSVVYKRTLWDEIASLKLNREGIWVIGGDFNAVRNETERLNLIFCPTSSLDFNNFIYQEGLHELNVSGQEFSSYSSDGSKRSRVDRFLVCDTFL